MVSRRSLLGLSLMAIAACKHKASAPPVDPDAAALAVARESEQELLASYDTAIASASAAAAPRLAAERALHAAHLTALGGATPGRSTDAFSTSTSVKALLRRSARVFDGVAVGALDGTHAAVFASIAASHEAMARG